MAIVTDLNGCFVAVNGDVNLIDCVIKCAKPWIKVNFVSNPKVKFIKFGVSYNGQISAEFTSLTPSPEFKEVYFRNGELHDCAEDTPVEHEVREIGGFKIGETVTFYRDELYEHLGVIEDWSDGEDLKIIAFAHIWGNWRPVVQNAKTQQVSPIVFGCIKKKMTPEQLKARIVEELVDNACEELFGCSIDDCHENVVDTVRAMIEDGYRKQ